MQALPWWRVMTGASSHHKVVGLCIRLEDTKADVYLWRIWDHCADKKADGRFDGPHAAALLERAARYDGPSGRLVDAMLAEELLDKDERGLEVHDWAEVQAALVAKFEKDRKRSNAKRRNPSANADELRGSGNPGDRPHDSPHDSRGDSLKTVARFPNGASPLSTLSSVSSKGVQGEARPAAHAALAPSLVERLAATFKRKRGADYGLNAWGEPMPQDLAGLKSALQQAKGDEAEVERRWEVALDWPGWPTCGCLADLGRFWNRYAAAKAAAPGDVRRGVVRAEDARHAPAGEVKL